MARNLATGQIVWQILSGRWPTTSVKASQFKTSHPLARIGGHARPGISWRAQIERSPLNEQPGQES